MMKKTLKMKRTMMKTTPTKKKSAVKEKLGFEGQMMLSCKKEKMMMMTMTKMTRKKRKKAKEREKKQN